MVGASSHGYRVPVGREGDCYRNADAVVSQVPGAQENFAHMFPGCNPSKVESGRAEAQSVANAAGKDERGEVREKRGV